MFLIDTDIFAHLLRGHETVEHNVREHIEQPMAMSAITYGELYVGALKSTRSRNDLGKVRRLAEGFTIHPVTRAVMETYATLRRDLEARGTRVDDFDLIIAATALNLGYRVVTGNERHFARIPDLPVENWTRHR